MKLKRAVSLVGLLAVLLFVVVTCVDQTVSPRASGKYVVQAVVDLVRSRCILPDDRLFLRRLAYVETRDGKDSKTFRSGYHGGIWQLNKNKYLQTKLCPSTIRSKCDLIKSKFNIDWRKTRWIDLQKPLYSGLEAALYILLKRRTIPGNVAAQGIFWTNYYHTGGKASDFRTTVHNIPNSGCSGELDLAFILDGSGSVSRFNFRRMLTFTKRVISGLTISDKATKIAVIEFASRVGQVIDFNYYSSTNRLLTSISNIKKSNSGTNTAAAINTIVRKIFTTAAGSRANAKYVALLLTDGASNSYTATVRAAKAAKKSGITLFVIGVGNVNNKELKAVASDPDCTHVFLLNNFQEIDSLLHEIQKSSCEASKVVSDDSGNVTHVPLPSNTAQEQTYELPANTTRNTNGRDKVVTAEVQCGILDVYASYSTPRPCPAFYDILDRAIDGKPAVVYLNTMLKKGRTLYITIIGTKLPTFIQGVLNCSDAYYSVSITNDPKRTSPVDWPQGTYGLPKTASGCPKGTWITAKRYHDTEDTAPNNYWSKIHHFAGFRKTEGVQEEFCMKLANSVSYNWPAGNYCILKKNTCPSGFSSGLIKWDDEDDNNMNCASPVNLMPDGIYGDNTEIHFCCRSDGSVKTAISLPTQSPFYLYRHSKDGCQAVKGMKSSDELLRIDDEDTNSKSHSSGSHPFDEGGGHDHKLHYCYYSRATC